MPESPVMAPSSPSPLCPAAARQACTGAPHEKEEETADGGPQSYHLLQAAVGPLALEPRALFAWCVDGVVTGLLPHRRYAQASRAARAAGLSESALTRRLATLAALDANPVAELMRGDPDDRSFQRRWNGYNRLAPLGVRTRLADGASVRLEERRTAPGIADDEFRRITVTACAASLRRLGDAGPSDDGLRRAWRALGLRGGCIPELLDALRLAPEADLARSATDLGCSTRTLQRQLGRAGLSHGQLRRAVRLSLAGCALRGAASLTEIAHAAGFYDSAHFAHAWRRACGITPSDYRALSLA